MTTINDLTAWRSHPQWQRSYLYLDKSPIVFQFTTSGQVFPFQTIPIVSTISGAYTAADPGMLVCFGSTGTTTGIDDLGRGVVQSITNSALTLSRMSQGVLDGEANVPMSGTYYVTIYDTFPVFSKPPFIATGTNSALTYKDGNLTFSAYGIHSPPLALINGGIGWADFIDPISLVVTLSLSATSSYATAPSASISSYLWDVKDGTITVGSTTTSSITATFPAGRRWIRLTVTDSNGKTGVRRFLIVGCTSAQGSTWEPIRKFNWTRSIKVEGQDVKIQLLQAIPTTDYLDGMVAIIWNKQYTKDTERKLFGPSGKEHVQFTGYHHFDNNNTKAGIDGLRYTTEFDLQDVGSRLKNLPGYPQTIERKASPSQWEQMASANIDFYLAYLYIWHSTASNVADFTWSGLGSTYPFPTLASDGMSLYDQIDQRAKAIRHRLTCDTYGRLAILPDPQLLITSIQSALGGQYAGLPVRTSNVTADLDGRDWWQAPIPFERMPKTGWQRGSAIIATATDASAVTALGTVFCISPGTTPGQGANQTDVGEQLTVNQTELNATMGHRYIGDNNPIQPLNLDLKNCLCPEAFSPALMTWVTLSINTNQAAWRGRSLSSVRFLPTQVDVTYNNSGQIQVKLVLDSENIGTPAATVIPPTVEDSGITPVDNLPSAVLTTDPVLNSQDPSTGGGAVPGSGWKNIALVCADGNVYYTGDFTTPSASGGPTWTNSIISGISGTPVLWIPDFFTLRSNSSNGKAYGWLITTTNCYYGTVGNAVSAPSFSNVLTFRNTSSLRSACASIKQVGHIAIVTDYSDGTYATYATTGGNFVAEYSVGAGGGTLPPGCAYSPHINNQVFSSVLSGGKKSTNGGSSYSSFSDINPGSDCATEIAVPYMSNPTDSIMYYRGDLTSHTIDYDFTTGTHGWQPETPPVSLSANYIGGSGFSYVDQLAGTSYYRGAEITLTMPSKTVTSVTFTYNYTRGSAGSGFDVIAIRINGSTVKTDLWDSQTDGTNKTYTFTGSTNITKINFFVASYAAASSPVYDGSILITKASFVVPTGNDKVLKSKNSVQTDVSPQSGFTPWKSNGQISISYTDSNIMSCVAADSTITNTGVWVSPSAGNSWNNIVPVGPSNNTTRCWISSDKTNTLILAGKNGLIAVSSNFGGSIDIRTGNIVTSGEIIGIASI